MLCLGWVLGTEKRHWKTTNLNEAWTLVNHNEAVSEH